MNSIISRRVLALPVLALLLTAAQAQEPQAPEAEAAAQAPPAAAPAAAAEDSATAGDEEATGPAAIPPPPTPFKDAPAEILPRAARSVLLDVAQADGAYVVVGERGHILRSTDGGKTWQQSNTPTRATLTAVTFTDDRNGWAVGHDAAILHTSDGGVTWEFQYFHPALEKPFLDVLFLDGQHGYVIGAYGLFLETRDGGASWTEKTTDIRNEEWHFNALTKLGNGSLLLVGETGGMALSGDGGATWKRLSAPYEGSYFGALPQGQGGAVIFGLRGNAFITGDVAGGSWQEISTGTEQGLLGGSLLPNGDYIIVGNNGVILRGAAGSSTVSLSTDPAGKPLSAVTALDGGELLLFGESGAHILQGSAQ